MGHPTNARPLVLGLPERFWVKTSIEDHGHPTPCVVWTGAKTDGYGLFHVERKLRRAHRVAHEALVGPILDGLVIDHLCRVRACVAVDHLEPVTPRVNILRGEGVSAQHAAKTHCPQGHPYDEANTHIRPSGKRRCRTCHNEQSRKEGEKTR